MMRTRWSFVVCPLVLAAATHARGDEVTLTPSKDNTLYETPAGDVSNGAGERLFAGRVASIGGGRFRRALIAFDIAGSIPVGSTINSASLRMNVSRTRFATVQTTSLQRVLADWGEGTSNAFGQEGQGTGATVGDATWLHTFFNTSLWTTPGGDFSPAASASVGVGGLGFYTWGSTAQMVANVQVWLDAPADNFGWIVIGNESVLTTAKRFDSRENAIVANRPALTIDFTPPVVFGACCDDLSGTCEEGIDHSVCLSGGGRFGGDESTCATIDPPCVVSGACCDDSTGTCNDLVTQADCTGAGFRYGGDESTCATIDPACESPPSTGACCDEVTGICTNDVEQAVCEAGSGRYGGDDSDCATLDPPCQGSGACCDDSIGSCADGVFESDCALAGFRYGGDASTCATIDPPCLPPNVGACCVELRGECLELIVEDDCATEGGRFGGAGSTCSTIDPSCEPAIAIGLAVVAGSPGGAATGGVPALQSPLRLTHAGDGSGRLFIVDQPGLIRIVKDDQLLAEPYLDLTSKIVALSPGFDERGLLGLAFHPDYATNGRFFVRYSAPGGEGDHRAIVAEYAALGDPATSDLGDLSSEIILFEVDEPEFNHNGGEIAFGPDGLLYFALGDGGGANDGLDDPGLPHGPIGNGQDIETALGAMLRIDVDSPPDPGLAYHIPVDNPLVGGAGLDEIYAWGFRNPYTFSFDDGPGGDGSLYLGDVGQDLFEEIDIVTLGGNYGWVIREGTRCFDPSNPEVPPAVCPSVGPVLGDPLIDPVMEYLQPISCANDAQCALLGVGCGSDGLCLNHGGISVMGGFVYRGSELTSLVGRYIFGDFDAGGSSGKLYYADTTGGDAFERREFFLSPSGGPLGQFIKGMGEDEDGEVYVCTSGSQGPFGTSGVVYRISTPGPGARSRAGSRYLAISLPDGPDPVGLVVTPACAAGVARYVGPPGDPDNTAVLVAEPTVGAFLTPAEWGDPIYVTSIDIVPDALYKIQLDRGTAGSPALSGAVTARTALWGDSSGNYVDNAWQVPDGDNTILDVLAVVAAFVGADGAPPVYQADMRGSVDPCTPDRAIDIIDALVSVNGFQGLSYLATFPECSEPCP